MVPMRDLLRSIRRLAPWQRVVVGAMILLILSTWLAACLVFASILA
jgi:hypothetical protein